MCVRVDTIRLLFHHIFFSFFFFVRRLLLCLISRFLSHRSGLVEASARFKLKVADRKVLPLRFPVDLTACPPFRQPSPPLPCPPLPARSPPTTSLTAQLSSTDTQQQAPPIISPFFLPRYFSNHFFPPPQSTMDSFRCLGWKWGISCARSVGHGLFYIFVLIFFFSFLFFAYGSSYLRLFPFPVGGLVQGGQTAKHVAQRGGSVQADWKYLQGECLSVWIQQVQWEEG